MTVTNTYSDRHVRVRSIKDHRTVIIVGNETLALSPLEAIRVLDTLAAAIVDENAPVGVNNPLFLSEFEQLGHDLARMASEPINEHLEAAMQRVLNIFSQAVEAAEGTR